MSSLRSQDGLHHFQALWIEIYTGRGRKSGIYEGSLRLQADGAAVDVPVELEILDFTLPDENSLNAMVYYEPDQPERYQGRNLDAEFHGTRFPYRDIFGGKPGPMFRIHLAKSIWNAAGSLEVGFRTGFWSKSGHALIAGTGSTAGQSSGDRTTFNIIPTSLTLSYRADQIYEYWRVPLVPYGRVVWLSDWSSVLAWRTICRRSL